MRAPGWLLIWSTVSLVTLSCGQNIFTKFSNVTTNEALFVDAQMAMNAADYAQALESIGKMSGDFATSRRVLALKASAYGGLCGIEFLGFVQALSEMGATRLYPFLVNHFRSGADAAKIDFCTQGEEALEAIGSVTERDADENMLLVLLNFAKIGNILSYYADADQDGIVTAGYNACVAGGARAAGGALTDSDVRQMGRAVTLAINAITQVSSSINLGNEALSEIQNACAQLGTLNPAYNFCSITEASSFTASHVKGIRSLIKEDQIVGLDPLGAGCNGDVSTCNCP